MTPQNSANLKIVGGNTSIPNSWPWQILLVEIMPDGKQSACGGSIINNEVIFF